jgi:hypothetical protein
MSVLRPSRHLSPSPPPPCLCSPSAGPCPNHMHTHLPYPCRARPAPVRAHSRCSPPSSFIITHAVSLSPSLLVVATPLLLLSSHSLVVPSRCRHPRSLSTSPRVIVVLARYCHPACWSPLIPGHRCCCSHSLPLLSKFIVAASALVRAHCHS